MTSAPEPDYRPAYRRLMLVVAVAMLGWAIPYAIANYQFDQCSTTLQVRLDAMKTKLDAARATTPQR
jgi:hypothetical protein